jgi:hypothetical protein
MNNKLNLLLLCVLFLLLDCCFGRFLVEKNSLKITSPKSLKGTYECAIGNFGVPQYGGTLIGSVVYPNVNKKGCRNFTDVNASFKSMPGSFPTFLLVDRGGEIFIGFIYILIACLNWQ